MHRYSKTLFAHVIVNDFYIHVLLRNEVEASMRLMIPVENTDRKIILFNFKYSLFSCN